MSTTGADCIPTATEFANRAIGKFRLTEAKLRALFANRNQPLFEQLTKWLDSLNNPGLLGVLAAADGEDGKSSGMTLGEAGIARQFSEQDRGPKTLVKLAALCLAIHTFNLLTGAVAGLDAEVTKRLDLRRRIETFGLGGKVDEEAIGKLLAGGVDPILLASVMEEMKEDAAFATEPTGASGTARVPAGADT
jgi:hypothetical protein